MGGRVRSIDHWVAIAGAVAACSGAEIGTWWSLEALFPFADGPPDPGEGDVHGQWESTDT